MSTQTQRAAMMVLRIGVAFSFLYPPIDALLDPYSWLGYFPAFMRGYVPDMVLLHSFGIFEVVIALWILSGVRIRYPSIIAALVLCAIVFFDSNNFSVLFRDLSIAAAALSLALFSWSPQRGQNVVGQTS